jgi:hypothetical protein
LIKTKEILFTQNSVSAYFSKDGNFKGISLSKVVECLKNGRLSPDSLPIKVIERNGQMITLNNRSLLALKRAKVQAKVVKNVTGDRLS